MSDVDDVTVIGAQPGDLVAQVERILGTALRSAPNGWATQLDDDIVVAVYRDRQPIDNAGPESWIVEVDNVGPNNAARHALAREIYQRLAASTDWDLILDSDDADDVLATRVRPRNVRSAR
jgi:hypothetical protein